MAYDLKSLERPQHLVAYVAGRDEPLVDERIRQPNSSILGGDFLAMILCPEHGRGSAAICSHFAALVGAGAPIRQPRFPVFANYAGHVLGPTSP